VSGYWDSATGLVHVLHSGPADKIDFGEDASLRVGKARCIAFGPGGKLLAVGDDQGVQLWDLPSEKKTRALPGLDQPAARLAFSARRHALAALPADGTSVVVWDLSRNMARCRISHDRGAIGSLALSPDGKMLATTAKDGKAIFLCNVEAQRGAADLTQVDRTIRKEPAYK